LWLIGPLSRIVGAAFAVAIGVCLTSLYNVLRLRTRPIRRTLERLVDYFAATTYLSNCYVYSGRLPEALSAAEQLLPFVHSRKRIPRVGYLMARVAALYAMNRFDEAAAGCEESLRILKQDTWTPVSTHDRIHAMGGALVTRLWVDLTRGYAKNSDWWKPVEEFVREHPTAMLESWLMEVRVFAASRQGRVVETERAWERFVQKAAQAEVRFVQARARFWLGTAYLDAGRTSDAQDMADEIIRIARAPDNPFILAYGTLLRGMALHAWEQLEDAEGCLEEAARVASRSDVACWELHHAVLLSQAALALDRDNPARALQLALHVIERNATLHHAHVLHQCQARRILGRVALGEGRHSDAIQELGAALEFATELDDALERAKTLHFLVNARQAGGDRDAAERDRCECAQLLNELENGYQLHRFGYAPADGPTSHAGVSVLSRVVELVSCAELGGHLSAQGPASGTQDCPLNSAQAMALALAAARRRDETLNAVDSSETLLSSTE
jgi:tetratricopeptide (TPR) repeat protein